MFIKYNYVNGKNIKPWLYGYKYHAKWGVTEYSLQNTARAKPSSTKKLCDFCEFYHQVTLSGRLGEGTAPPMKYVFFRNYP